jgi:hypothetical protein
MRWALAWTLFWCGDAISRFQRLFPDDWRIQTPMYRVYGWFMSTSDAVQAGGPGPWKEVSTVAELSADPKVHTPRK